MADHYGPDFQQHEPNAVRTGLGQGGPFQGFATQPFEQGICQAWQQLPERIRPPALAGRAVGKPVQWLILDPVFHIATGTVDLVIQVSVGLRQIGHHEPRIGPVGAVLRLDDHPAGAVPTLGAVLDRSEQALLVS